MIYTVNPLNAINMQMMYADIHNCNTQINTHIYAKLRKTVILYAQKCTGILTQMIYALIRRITKALDWRTMDKRRK